MRSYATLKKKRTPFEVLSLPENASRAAIKKRYYELAKTLHPDKPGGNAEAFQEMVRAYELLYDPKRRALYERTGLGWAEDLPPRTHENLWRGTRPNYHYDEDNIRYKGGPWSSHDSPRFMNNGTFISIVAGLAMVLGIVQLVSVLESHSSMMHAADRHHWRTSLDLERARTEAKLFGNQRAVERMLDHRMKYWRPSSDNEKEEQEKP